MISSSSESTRGRMPPTTRAASCSAHGITYPVVFDPNADIAANRYAVPDCR